MGLIRPSGPPIWTQRQAEARPATQFPSKSPPKNRGRRLRRAVLLGLPQTPNYTPGLRSAFELPGAEARRRRRFTSDWTQRSAPRPGGYWAVPPPRQFTCLQACAPMRYPVLLVPRGRSAGTARQIKRYRAAHVGKKNRHQRDLTYHFRAGASREIFRGPTQLLNK